MAGTVINFEIDQNMNMGRAPAQYVDARVLSATTAEEITIPAGATHVILDGSGAFNYLFLASGSSSHATIPADTDDGTACAQINPNTDSQSRTFLCKNYAKISVISSGTPTVTAEFYKS